MISGLHNNLAPSSNRQESGLPEHSVPDVSGHDPPEHLLIHYYNEIEGEGVGILLYSKRSHIDGRRVAREKPPWNP